jgi:hypothetical protein
MKNKLIILLSGLLLCGLTFGCSRHLSAIEGQKHQWTQEGWNYFETFGKPADDAVYTAQMDSSTARSVSAFASSGGVSTNRIYEQTNQLYLVVTMQRPNGDTFALVFERPKP